MRRALLDEAAARAAAYLTVLQFLDAVGSPATMATAGPGFFGFVIGGTLEQAAVRWLIEAWPPPECAGGFVAGATLTTFTALAAAHHSILAGAGWDVDAACHDHSRRTSLCGGMAAVHHALWRARAGRDSTCDARAGAKIPAHCSR